MNWPCFEAQQRLLHEITEGRMTGNPTTERRIQMLHDLANDDGFVALKWAAGDRGQTQRERMSKALLYSTRLVVMTMEQITLALTCRCKIIK